MDEQLPPTAQPEEAARAAGDRALASGFHLITGGGRSGKSSHAQRLAELCAAPRLYIATCPVLDDELRQRIDEHRRARAGRGWETLEEPWELAAAIARARGFGAVLIDCVTLWINNLMYRAAQGGRDLRERDIAAACDEVIAAVAAVRQASRATVIFVTNEVGSGIVPENAAARRFRDLAGRANQLFAAAADTVTLVCCGIPLQVKGTRAA